MSKYIDFYVEVIDNFGDLGFAVSLGKLLIDDSKIHVRIFSNNQVLFKNMITDYSHKEYIKYYNLDDIYSQEPSEIIFNFFDRKIDFNYLHTFGKSIQLLNFGYFLLHDGVEDLHGTKYQIQNVSVEHIIPSLKKNTGGVVVGKKIFAGEKTQFLTSLSQKYNVKYTYEIGEKIASIFVYQETLDALLKNIQTNDTDITYFIFGVPNKNIHTKNIITMPFVSMEDYEKFLSICDFNIIRGENSLIQSIMSGKPTLWDIYKENNMAHFQKIDDYINFLSGFPRYRDDYGAMMKIFNTGNSIDGFTDFTQNYLLFHPMFEELSKYVYDECNLYEKIKKNLNI